MANDLKINDLVSKEIARRFNAQPTIVSCLNNQYNVPTSTLGSKSGSSIRIKKAQVVPVVESSTYSAQDYTEKEATLNLNKWSQANCNFTSEELTYKLENPNYLKGWGDDLLQPAIDAIITNIDSRVSLEINKLSTKTLGTAGTGPNTAQIATQMKAHLDNMRAPAKERYAIFNPNDAALLNFAQSSFFNPAQDISKQWREGGLEPMAGFAFWSSPNVQPITTGARNTGYLVNGASQSGTSLIVDTGTGTAKAGEKFTIAGVYEVDPVTGLATNRLKTYVVGADYAGGGGTITLGEEIVTSGPYKNVSGAPADNAAITFIGSASTTYGQNLFFQRDAFVFGSAQLANIGVTREIPIIVGGNDATGVMQGQPMKGIALKLTLDGDVQNFKTVCRLDCSWGIGALQNGWSGTVQGA